MAASLSLSHLSDGSCAHELGDVITLIFKNSQISLRVPKGVHLDPQNSALLAHVCDAVQPGDRILYPGCGAGLLGLFCLGDRNDTHVHFSDVCETSVSTVASNLIDSEYSSRFSVSVSDLNDAPDLTQDIRYDVVVCNPPQMPGPLELQMARPDKYGGADGTHYYRRLSEWAVALLRQGGGRVIFMQTSFSSFQAVDHLFRTHGFNVRTLFAQTRRQSLSQIDELAPGCGDWLQRLRKASSADFAQELEANGDVALIYEQRIAVAERGADIRGITH